MGNLVSSLPKPVVPTRPGQTAPVPPPPGPDEIMKYYNDHVPGYQAFTIAAAGVSLLLDTLLLTSGIGLLNMSAWARWLSLIYAPLSILNRLVTSVYQFVLVIPATEGLYAQNPVFAGMSSFLSIFTGVGVFVGLLFIAYPIAVLIVLLMPSTAAAFRGESPADVADSDEKDSYLDDDEPEPPRSNAIRR